MDADERYLHQLKEGQPAAYERLTEQFEGRLYRFFLCHHRNHHLAEEQTAETFAQLVRSLPSMNSGPERLGAFVFAVARHVRSRQWRSERSHASLQAADRETPDARPSPFRRAADRDELSRVLDAIGAMSADVRDVFLLRFVEGYSLAEVADALDVPVGTVKSHIHRGRARLKAMLSNSECSP